MDMSMGQIMLINLTSPAILFFALGALSVFIKSGIKIPDAMGYAVVMFLMAAIGLRAGAEITVMPGGIVAVVPFALTALAFGVGIAAVTYFCLNKFFRLDPANSGGLAAAFGAVSSATMMVSISLVEALGLPYEAYVPALYPFMDSPAIIASLFLAKLGMAKQALSRANGKSPGANVQADKVNFGKLAHSAVTSTGVYVLIGGLVIGLIVGDARLEREMHFFGDMFRGVLCLFMLEMGILAASRVTELKSLSPLIIPFALVVAFINGVLSVFAATALGLSVGGVLIFSGLAAGASYVTVPAAMRSSLPEANPSLYLGIAIGIVFPFNMAIGLPAYLQIAQMIAR